MKRKIMMTILVVGAVLFMCGCSNKDAQKFKSDYESINGKENSSGKVHRTINIDENNPYVYATAEEIVKKMENKETFYVYFGDKLCPWCRSVIEKSIQVAKENNIKTIYYVPIWDDEGNEILRDRLKVNEQGKLEIVKEGTESYKKLLELLDNVLSEYNLTDKDGKKVETKEKRIYAPNFIYVESGEAKKLIAGISEKQSDSREELTEEILKDEEEAFKSFFQN
ncbi:MAG: hypothetical protein IJ743_00990 [Bacilli bacterium]|nr:hypothetical protein [Bacilli bacterium]